MKQILKTLLFNKRIQNLKSRRGFSLLEVLIAVGIIAIISAIAVPQYTANKENAAKVAGETSVSNILKAYNHCTALNSFASCDSLEDLKVVCPDCQSESDGTNKFCAYISKGDDPANPDFTACVSIDTTGGGNPVVARSYGGKLMTGAKICATRTRANTSATWGNWGGATPLKNCKDNSGTPPFCGTNTGTAEYDCKAVSQNGTCASNVCT